MSNQSREQTERARMLRRTMQPSQKRLWQALRKLQEPGLRFRQEAPVGGRFIDIYCHAAQLAIEVDGSSHRFAGDSDERRDAQLQELGVETIRIPAADIRDGADAIAAWIVQKCKERIAAAALPSPRPRLRRDGPLPEGEVGEQK
jgi:very-short-patch-repair endonuclease